MNHRPPHNKNNASSADGDESAGSLAGQRLAEARRANNISITEIAKELHLDESKVQALEENQFAVLGAPVFAKGHMRKYAELVGVPIDDVLADYYELNRSVGASPVFRPRKRKPPLDLMPGPRIVGAIIIVVLAGVLYWLFGRQLSWDLTSRKPAVLEPFVSEQNVNNRDSGSVPAAADDAVDAASTTPVDELPKANETVAGGIEAVDLDAEDLADGDSLGGIALVLTFSGDCWTEVTDADGERLFFGLGQAGQTVARNGIPPLHALFGQSANVRVSVDGVEFEIPDAGRRGNTAKVTINAR